jgi:formylglycine-generating enzyme required for sulfatase activity
MNSTWNQGKKLVWLVILGCLLGVDRRTDGAESIQEETNSIGMRLLEIPAGEFRMGNLQEEFPSGLVDLMDQQVPRGEKVMIHGDWDERPIHPVTISTPFKMSETEVTIEQYKRFRPEYSGEDAHAPYATGASWEDAMAFCEWLSTREGRPYRLPTEAEWEYVCRAGTSTPFWSGDRLPNKDDRHPWGVRNLHSGVSEWCLDWYGPYPAGPLHDPVGPKAGKVRVIRGGIPEKTPLHHDQVEAYYQRSANRAGLPENFRGFDEDWSGGQQAPDEISDAPEHAGLIGITYGSADLTRPNDVVHCPEPDSSRIDWDHGSDWSAEWTGFLTSPVSGEIPFEAEANNGVILEIGSSVVIDAWEPRGENSGSITMEAGRPYPVRLLYYTDGDPAFMRIYWTLPGQTNRAIVSAEALSHSSRQLIERKEEVVDEDLPKPASVGFRVVQAPMPDSVSWPVPTPFVQTGVKRTERLAVHGPDPKQPWFHRRIVYPVPFDSRSRREIDAAGFPPFFRGHNHSPAMEIAENGDLLYISYTSYGEYEPGVSMIMARLRLGSNQWDFANGFFDIPDVNVHAPMLWRDNERLYFFFGTPRLAGAYPFSWITSDDHGANWSPVQYPRFAGTAGPNTRQPISSAVKTPDGTFMFASDAVEATSVIWLSRDGMQTWEDPGSRTGGRHTVFCQLEDGSLFAMGGKNSDIEGFMPQFRSYDDGESWTTEKSPFASLGSNQRPSLIRLRSGRLFFAGDKQKRGGEHPPTIAERGVLVALSEDGGRTWITKELMGTLPHDDDQPPWGTIGYSVARQAPDGIIHLATSKTDPIIHFELNEAWILDANAGEDLSPDPIQRDTLKSYEETWPDGRPRHLWRGGVTDSGNWVLDGEERWNFADGRLQYRVLWDSGKKAGRETYWDPTGIRLWEWQHKPGGASTWRQFHPNGRIKAESTWREMRLEGMARRWDVAGQLISAWKFTDGHGRPLPIPSPSL